MWSLSYAIGMGILGSLTIADLQFRKVPAEILGAAGIAALVYQAVCRRESLWMILGGAAVGAVFLFLSWVTKEKIGYGDSLAILILGVFLGLWGLVRLLSAAFALLALFSVALLIRKKMRRRLALPFYPFLAAGYLICIYGGGYL